MVSYRYPLSNVDAIVSGIEESFIAKFQGLEAPLTSILIWQRWGGFTLYYVTCARAHPILAAECIA